MKLKRLIDKSFFLFEEALNALSTGSKFQVNYYETSLTLTLTLPSIGVDE